MRNQYVMGITHPENNAVLQISDDGVSQWETSTVIGLTIVHY
jgi:hypothetical protein